MLDSQTNESIDQFINQLSEGIPESVKEAFDNETTDLRAKISNTVELILSHPSNTKPNIEGIVKSKVDEWVRIQLQKLHYTRYCKLIYSTGKKPWSIRRFGYGTESISPLLRRFLCYERNNLSIGSIVTVSQGLEQPFEAEISGITVDFFLNIKKDGKRVKGNFNPARMELV